MEKPIVLIDCDMVLLDFNQAIANTYEKVFHKKLKIIDNAAFKAINKYDFSSLPVEEQEFMKTVVHQYSFWENMPAMPGSVEFAKKLAEHFTLVVLTSMPIKFEQSRMQNLTNLGIPVSKVIAVARVHDQNPKKKLAEESGAVLFIDDLAINFEGLNNIATKLILLNWNYSEKVNDKREGLRIDHEVTTYNQLIEEVLPYYIQQENNNKINKSVIK